MNSFVNSKISKGLYIIPLEILPFFYNEYIEYIKFQNKVYVQKNTTLNFISHEIPFILYLNCWQSFSLLILNLIEDKLGYDQNEIKISNKLLDDFGADSLDIVEIYISLEKIFGISINVKLEFEKVVDLIDYIFLATISNLHDYTIIWPAENSESIKIF